jgi:hypothetical protein
MDIYNHPWVALSRPGVVRMSCDSVWFGICSAIEHQYVLPMTLKMIHISSQFERSNI